MHLAAWRETEAQQRDLPRNRVLRDETLIDLAGSNPQTTADFAGIRNFPGGKEGKLAAPVLKILHKVAALPDTAPARPAVPFSSEETASRDYRTVACLAETCLG